MGLFGDSHIKRLLTLVFLTSVIVGVSSSAADLKKLPFCGPNNGNDPEPSKNLVFVSTLDGHVTALNAKDGSEKWSLQAGSPLLSSSIHRLELSNGGQWVRLVPSLGGSLYRFSGDSLEPLPLSADQLLSSSHKYSNDLVIAGGKETASIGVSTRTGRVVYECNLSGCVNATDLANSPELESVQKTPDEELLLIRRVTQTVRAVEPRTVQERWNFSVGQHELSVERFEGCVLPPSPLQSSGPELLYKVVVPEGLICAVLKKSPSTVIWKHKLSSPVVGAWHAGGPQLQAIDLFGAAHVPPHPDGSQKPSAVSPAVYIGMHDRQLYIQESVRMQALVQSHSTARPALADSEQYHSSLLIPWKPVSARSDWDTNTPSDTALVAITSQSVLYASEYINGNGYYLYTNEDQKLLEGPTCGMNHSSLEEQFTGMEAPSPILTDEEEEIEWDDGTTVNIIVVSLWFWWKEVSLIAIGTAVCLNFLSNKFRRIPQPQAIVHREIVVVEHHVEVPVRQMPEPPIPSFTSRYLSDFDPVQCLGRGGFGIVFEARNKIDDCSYAVKRITLPNRTERRDKVLREVKALAKLEHNHIVRYFQAWLEEPPIDWEDPLEKELKAGADYTGTYSKIQSSNNTDACRTNQLETKDKSVYFKLPINECIDALEYDKFKSNAFDISRQRSYSLNDSVSIVFDQNTGDRSQSIDSNEDSYNKYNKLNESVDDDSFIVFANGDESQCIDEVKTATGESVISISDSDFHQISLDEPDGLPVPNTQLVCINESPANKKPKRMHRRNLSLDLQSTASHDRRLTPPMGKMYLYIQMQLCRRESLRDWLRQKNSPEMRIKEEILSIFEQIVYAVEYVHLQRLIHRDLKPSNIFFSSDGRIKVGDFGLVTTMGDPLADSARSPILGMPCESGNDRHTQLVGTHLYMSPEQLRGEAHGYKVDIWSLGLVLAELLIPFSTEMERVEALKALRDHRFPNGFQNQYPQEYSLLCLMLSPEATQRPSTLGVRARAPLLHTTDPRYQFSLPPRLSHSSMSSDSMPSRSSSNSFSSIS